MKVKCRQCGAGLAVTTPDAFLNCPYCGARGLISGFTGQSFFHRPVLSKEDAERLFPPESIASSSIYWFPYHPETLKRCFTQPYAEMDTYSPPSADRRIWNESEAEGTVIPVDPDLAEGEGVIYHPFRVMIRTGSGQGIIVDAVSGSVAGSEWAQTSSKGFNPYREAFAAFTAGVIPAVVLFFLLKGFSFFWAAAAGMAAAIITPFLFDVIRGRNR
ncbi:hypothetical protein CSA37_06515 [Candidatus Fermentibacteria bacterium]|nr:MAG: hypothetical protein CSA37_06515 [Candidatus Fermentibacteria bacterium]